MGQLVFFSVLLWITIGGSVQLLRESLLRAHPDRDAAACRAELAALEDRRVVARAGSLSSLGSGEHAVLVAYRDALDDPPAQSGISWDKRVFALVDECPQVEAKAARALARLRALDEVSARIDAQRISPAYDSALRTLGAALPAPSSSPTP